MGISSRRDHEPCRQQATKTTVRAIPSKRMLIHAVPLVLRVDGRIIRAAHEIVDDFLAVLSVRRASGACRNL